MITNLPSGFEKAAPAVAAMNISRAHVRQIVARRDDVVLVRTSLGIATLIELGSRPLPAIIGDSQSFKLEYLENGVTIKPLKARASTNLYLFTNTSQFNIELRTVDKAGADYVVYLKRDALRNFRPPVDLENDSVAGAENNLVRLQLVKVSVVDKNLVLHLKIKAKEPMFLKPEWFYVIARGHIFPIDQLEIEKTSLATGESVNVRITLMADRFFKTNANQFELRSPQKIVISLKEVKKWLNR